MTYKHCNMTWECPENHWEGDVCLVCGEKVKPEPDETENEEGVPDYA